MKLKNLIISASVAAAGSGLLATVLTSCAQAHIDDDLKIELNDQGLFTNDVGFAAVVKNALTRSDSWATFKQALADEIVFKWYEDRASADKGDTTKNVTFRTNLDEWKYEIDKDYNSVVDTCKSKYGANWQWYLQNEYLSAYGGTEDNYKHAKLVEKVKNDFITNAFANDYFGYAKKAENADYPHILTEVTLNPSRDELNNPANWEQLGFYARENRAFPVTDLSDLNKLAKYPDGDYAILQNFVFDKWFETEKPFFSAAALFKYSLPNQTAEKKLTDIYSNKYVTIPDAPNEAFPFFGGVSIAQNGSTGVKACYEWYQAFLNGEFNANGRYGAGRTANGTTSIPTNYTEDSQTLLLCYGKDMMSDGSNSLYVPYATAAGDLYNQMLGSDASIMNSVDQTFITKNILMNGGTVATRPQGEDDFRILGNFMFKGTHTLDGGIYKLKAPTDINSYLDLANIYGEVKTGTWYGTDTYEYYKCPLFKTNSDYEYFTGSSDSLTASPSQYTGVKYVTNRVQSTLTDGTVTQPWVLELNEAGMHAQTIDGYSIVAVPGRSFTERKKALKQVVMYRLMQQKQDYDGGMISASVLGSDGALKTYFNDNFANIVLEMAMSTQAEENIFRNISSYEESSSSDPKELFLDTLCTDQALGEASLIKSYLDATKTWDLTKKNLDTIIAANNRIYQYRKTQIENTRGIVDNKRYENGLLAPLPLSCGDMSGSYHTAHVYRTVVLMFLSQYNYSALQQATDNVKTAVDALFTTDPSVDGSSGFSLMVSEAKKAQSNRAWFKSPIVDKFMYTFMGTGGLANAIKIGTYTDYYTNKALSGQYEWSKINDYAKYQDAKTTVYNASKLLASDNFAKYTSSTTADFFSVIGNDDKTVDSAYTRWKQEKELAGGQFSAEALDEELFRATVAYLAANDFANFYTALNKQIGDDEAAILGYVVKYDEYEDQTGYVSLYNADPVEEVTFADTNKQPFDWTMDVDNIFDNLSYHGWAVAANPVANTKVTSDFYNNVIKRSVNGKNYTLGGFTGIQTAGSNQLDADSGLKAAVFENLGQCVDGAKNIADSTTHGQNDGVLFPWAGAKDAKGEYYSFEQIDDPRPSKNASIVPQTFIDAGLQDALKLAKKIAECSTIDDLKTLATSLGKAIDGYDIFDRIGSGAYPPVTDDPNLIVNEIKYVMLEEFVKDATQVTKYKPYFARLTDVQLHATYDKGGEDRFCFDSGDRYGYKIMFTQVNKSDIIEKRLTPKWNGSWDVSDMKINEAEFWYLLAKLAADSSTQQLAITEAIKQVHGDNKLTVYDAQLYNQFDSTWIKDWKKKPIGGEGA